jgi:hypothetical protein
MTDVFRNIEFSDSIHRPGIKKQTKGPGRWIESENSIFLKVIHHRQNPIVTTMTDVSTVADLQVGNRMRDLMSMKQGCYS